MAKSLLHFCRTCVVGYSRNLRIQRRIRKFFSFITSHQNLHLIKQLAKGLFPAVVLINFITCAFNTKSPVENLNSSIFLYVGSKVQSNSEIELRNKILKIVSNIKSHGYYPELKIVNPYNETIFPLDIASPTIIWEDKYLHSKIWLIVVGFENNNNYIYVLTDRNTWTPNRKIWEIIKANSSEKRAFLTIAGVNHNKSFEVITKSSITISTSKDEVEAPILFQHMPLPFAKAKKNPHLSKWRLGDIGSYDVPPVVLEKLPVCGNCHAFSPDGRLFGMDIDYKGDKGAYVFTRIEKVMMIHPEDFISWNDFRPSENRESMGLFSQISPDGNFIVSTVKETSFFTMIPDINFSQFFFPIRGLIAFYDERTKSFAALAGADSEQYVQTSPAWSPDGKYVVFARAKVDQRLVDLIGDKGYFTIGANERIDDLNKKFQIRFNLYRVPFRNGKGGVAIPLRGASYNGRSNFFPRYSPDGKWIVFTQSETGLAIQPDSELYIIPAEGGVARRLDCNTQIMNSWHSWSPNGKWIVFSSKINSPYTQLFLTHIDCNGNASPPILLSRFSSDAKACIAPEFLNTKFTGLQKILVDIQ